MANPDKAEARTSRRALITGGSLTGYEKSVMALFVGMAFPLFRRSDTDRVDLLTIDGQERAIFSSAKIGTIQGAFLGACFGAGLIQNEKVPRRDVFKKVVETTVAGIIFSSLTPPITGAWGEVDTNLIQPKLKRETSYEALDKLRNESQKAQKAREQSGQ